MMQTPPMQMAVHTAAVYNTRVYEDWRLPMATSNTGVPAGPLIAMGPSYIAPNHGVENHQYQALPQPQLLHEAIKNQQVITQYVMDGQFIYYGGQHGKKLAQIMGNNDAATTIKNMVMRTSDDETINVVSMQGEPLLRYHKSRKEIHDLVQNKRLVTISMNEKTVYWGSQFDPKPKDKAASPSQMCRYAIQGTDSTTLNVFLYEADTNRHIATFSRSNNVPYPIRLFIHFPDVRNHMLLCLLSMVLANLLPLASQPPASEYVTNGQTITDSNGKPVAQFLSLANGKGTDIISMEGQPLLRYDRPMKAVRDLRLKPGVDPRKKEQSVLATISHQNKSVCWGSNLEYWDEKDGPMPKGPIKLYRYTSQEADAITLVIYIYDADPRSEPKNRLIATVTRLNNGAYPSRIAIQPNVPFHMMLCLLFLI